MAHLMKMDQVKVGDAFYFTDHRPLAVLEIPTEDKTHRWFRLTNGRTLKLRRIFAWLVNTKEEIDREGYETFLDADDA